MFWAGGENKRCLISAPHGDLLGTWLVNSTLSLFHFGELPFLRGPSGCVVWWHCWCTGVSSSAALASLRMSGVNGPLSVMLSHQIPTPLSLLGLGAGRKCHLPPCLRLWHGGWGGHTRLEAEERPGPDPAKSKRLARGFWIRAGVCGRGL